MMRRPAESPEPLRDERDRARSRRAHVGLTLTAALAAGALVAAPVDARPAQAAVPPATAGTAVITVKVASDRVGVSSSAGLAGVTLSLYDGGAGGPNPTPRADAWASCVSDADGDCSFSVPVGAGGVAANTRFWIQQTGSPAGYRANPALATGTSGQTTTPYRFRTGATLLAGSTYRSSADFMIGTGNTNDAASGGVWQVSRTNPAFPPQCGLDVALILDLSGSVAPDLPELKAAADQFVDSLTGTPSAVALYTFAADAPAAGGANLALTPVSTAAGATTVKTRIAGYSAGGGTNWDRGFAQVAQSGTTYDLAVVVTDGNPTYYTSPPDGPGNYTRLRETENGIFSANAIKAKGTRVVAFGVGAGVSGPAQNLVAVSGPVSGSDYYQTADYAGAGAALRALALGNCAGSVSVVKQIVPATAPPGSTAGASPAGGWSFAAGATAGVGVTPASGVTATGTGAVSFDLSFPGGTSSTAVTIGETQQAGFTLQQVAGANAVCTDLGTGLAVPVTNAGATSFTVAATPTTSLSCVVYNRAPNLAASLTVTKTWVVNGATAADGNQLPGLSARLSLDGTATTFGTTVTGRQQGDVVAVDESTVIAGTLSQCRLVSARVTDANGIATDAALPYSATLVAGANAYRIVNTVECGARLSLAKEVQGGPADPAGWTLSALAPSGALSGPSGASGSAAATGAVTPQANYALAESGGDPRYVQVDNRNPALSVPGSTGSWTCVPLDADGNPLAGSGGGLNGGVIVPLGNWYRCTAVNRAATLVLAKTVVNEHGGSATPADWTLTATPVSTPPAVPPAGVVAESVPGSEAGAALTLRPGQQYALSESGPAGYEQTALECDTGPGGAFVPATDVTIPALGTVHCRFTNTDTPARLTLVKDVDAAGTGVTVPPTAWTLAAAGPTPLFGASGSTGVTAAEVDAGTYTLSESGGPAGFLPSAWVCAGGGSLSGSALTLAPGEDVVCTVTNTAQPATWSIAKTSDPASGSTVEPGDTITYTITLRHTGGVQPDSLTVVDDLAGVLDHATLSGTPTASSGTVTRVGDQLRWTLGDFSAVQTLSFRVVVAAGAWGVHLVNAVTPPPGGVCDPSCRTDHPTPHWTLEKRGTPANGSTVHVGDTVQYTLVARNDSDGVLDAATAVDDLSGLAGFATLVQPLPAGLSVDPADHDALRWAVPELAPGAEATVTFSVVIGSAAPGHTLRNVAVPLSGGECAAEPQREAVAAVDPCTVVEIVPPVDLSIRKTHLPLAEGAVDSGEGDTIDYVLTVDNEGEEAAEAVVVTDPLPAGLTVKPGTIAAPAGWDVSGSTATALRATFPGPFAPGASVEIRFTAVVGVLAHPVLAQPIAGIENRACVAELRPEQDAAGNCATDVTPVKSVGVSAQAVCVNDTPILDYRVDPANVGAAPRIAIIWWTPQGYAARDPHIPATDTAALLADGAQRVDPLTLPPGWTPGTSFSGSMLWPGAAVNAAGEPTAWPGWRQQADGTWVLDPSAPFYDLRGAAVVEVRVNPSTATTLVYPPATPQCAAQPPQTAGSGGGGGGGDLPWTGSRIDGLPWWMLALLVAGLAAAVVGGRRRRRE